MVLGMGKMVLEDEPEHMELDTIMQSLGVVEGINDMKGWEEEESWIVDWLEIQDRLGLGPEQGDIVMAEIEPRSVSSMMEME